MLLTLHSMEFIFVNLSDLLEHLVMLQTSTFANNFKSKYECKDQESIQSSTTPDQGYQWESDKFTD